MGRHNIGPKPTDEEIMSYDNVPAEIASKYLGWSGQAVRAALRQGVVPFGSASQPSGTAWSFYINPILLVKCKHGEIPLYQLEKAQAVLIECVEAFLDAKLEGLNKILGGVTSA